MDDRTMRQMQEDEPSIQVSDNGPLLIRGPIELIDMDGEAWNRDTKNLALCRCGQSGNKPFCDGSHAEASFESAPRAIKEIHVPDMERRAG